MSLSRLTSSLDSIRDDVRTAIGQAAQKSGVDFSYLLAQAKTESGLNPTARASSSSAAGLYQFLDQSWLAVVKKHGSENGLGWAADAITPRAGGGFAVDPSCKAAVMALREQPGPAALMAAAFASDNAAGLNKSLGRQASSTDLYFCHFLGLQGATRFLKAADASPRASAASLFPREAQANRSIFFDKSGGARSLADVYDLMGSKMAAAGADDGAAAPGSLSPTAPDGTGASFRLASLTDALAGDDGHETSSSDGGDDVATALAALSKNRMDMLRPTPAQARLAYLMLSTPMA